MRGRVLIVAGSDSGGGAGIQADLKTVTALGAYGATAITALTAQNTLGVHGVLPIPTDFVQQQMRVVLSDLGADVVKTGMLHDAATIDAVLTVLSELDRAERPALVVDPVMVAKGGARLLADAAIDAARTRLVPAARVLTPNAPEAEALTGISVNSEDAMRRAADALLALGAGAVVMKGGHVPGPTVIDLVLDPTGVLLRLEAPRLTGRATHGTGCTLASAIAARLAQGASLTEAARDAHTYVRRAMETAPGLGRGHQPLNHAHPLERR